MERYDIFQAVSGIKGSKGETAEETEEAGDFQMTWCDQVRGAEGISRDLSGCMNSRDVKQYIEGFYHIYLCI